MKIPEGFTQSATFYKEITCNHLSFFICRWGETLNSGFNVTATTKDENSLIQHQFMDHFRTNHLLLV